MAMSSTNGKGRWRSSLFVSLWSSLFLSSSSAQAQDGPSISRYVLLLSYARRPTDQLLGGDKQSLTSRHHPLSSYTAANQIHPTRSPTPRHRTRTRPCSYPSPLGSPPHHPRASSLSTHPIRQHTHGIPSPHSQEGMGNGICYRLAVMVDRPRRSRPGPTRFGTLHLTPGRGK